MVRVSKVKVEINDEEYEISVSKARRLAADLERILEDIDNREGEETDGEEEIEDEEESDSFHELRERVVDLQNECDKLTDENTDLKEESNKLLVQLNKPNDDLKWFDNELYNKGFPRIESNRLTREEVWGRILLFAEQGIRIGAYLDKHCLSPKLKHDKPKSIYDRVWELARGPNIEVAETVGLLDKLGLAKQVPGNALDLPHRVEQAIEEVKRSAALKQQDLILKSLSSIQEKKDEKASGTNAQAD